VGGRGGAVVHHRAVHLGGNYPIVLLPLAYAYRIGFGLQRHDRELQNTVSRPA
jgi:hypothetical protein